MTIEELLDCSADKLMLMTTEDLLLWFGPKLKITRPELARQERRQSSGGNKSQSSMDFMSAEEKAKRAKVKDILAELGMSNEDIDNL